MKKIKKIASFLAISMTLAAVQSCGDYAHSNVNTMITTDCGVTWTVVKSGEKIPTSFANPCHYKVTIPDYPMQGDSKFKIMFKGNVLANIDVSYNYVIINPIAFMGEAKYLGKANSKSDDETNKSSGFEMAENTVIDKRIKDIAREMLIAEDVVDFSPSDFENKLTTAANKSLNPLGIQLDYVSFVPVFEEQTSQAIDVATALKIYESKGIKKEGLDIIIAKAGAAKITLENKQAPAAQGQ